MKPLLVETPAFGMNEAIPRKYTGEGQDVSPPLVWTPVPAGTKEIALIVDDPDAPRSEPWVHWVLYHIPPEATGLPEGIPNSVPASGGMLQGINSWNRIGYNGPMPPPGHGRHRYHFRLYALDAPLNLEPGLTKDALLEAMLGHVLAEGELVGTYQR